MDLATSFDACGLPLFTNIHGDITKKGIHNKITPYYSIDFGFNMNLVCDYIPDVYYTDEILFTPEIGVRIKDHYYIGINLFFSNRSYSYYDEYDYDNNKNYGSEYEFYGFGLSRLSLKFGYKIPLKNMKF